MNSGRFDGAVRNRYDFLYYFDVEYGNPNGDPSLGGQPRVDPSSGRGLVTDVALKRMVRDYVGAKMAGVEGYDIYVRSGANLAELEEGGLSQAAERKGPQGRKKKDPQADLAVRDYMCASYYDIRAFGAVMTTLVQKSLSCGQVRGPVQLTFARSVDRVEVLDTTITRVAGASCEKDRTIGHKYVVPYALYACRGFINAAEAMNTTGFSEADLDLFWESLANMLAFSRSATKGFMTPRALVAFKHPNAYGVAQAAELFSRVATERRPECGVAQSWEDYGRIVVDREGADPSIEILELL